MYKLIMAFLLSLVTLIVNAGNTPPISRELPITVTCADTQTVLDYLALEYSEKMVWIGKTIQYESYIALYKNVEKGTWTMVQYDGRLACVLGAGVTGTPI
jgi:hypothetical protein